MLAGEDTIDSLLFVEECYKKREDLAYPWQTDDVSHFIRPPLLPVKILIVGASGFLGTRLAEILSLDLGLKVDGTYRRPERAVRLARLPLELVECDVLDRTQVEEAVKGCDIVVNCAAGKIATSANTRTASKVYTDGTRNLVEAAERLGVRKFIHISTAAIHGFKHDCDIIDETCHPKARIAQTWYERGKASQDKILKEFGKSMPVVILKPTLIYGPFSQSWVGNIIQQLNRNQPVFVEDGGIANLVYVDDVVYAVIHAIECDAANDGSFFINNDDKRISWADYVAQLASFSHVSPRAHPSGDLVLIRVKKLAAMLFDSLFVFGRNLSSQEMLVMLAEDPFDICSRQQTRV